MNILKRYWVIGYWLLVIGLAGCATVTEGAKGFAGVSTKTLEDSRKDAITKTFNHDYFTCYTKTSDILKRIGAYIYAQDVKKHMFAIYVSGQDTTPVGIFFKEMDAAHTQIEVASPSIHAREFIAARLFAALEKEQK